MRFTTAVLGLTCLVAAASIMSATGIGAQFGGTPDPGVQDEVDQLGEDLDEVESDQRGTDSIVGLAISAMSWTASLVKLLLLAPIALTNMGIPATYAIPLSLPIYAMTAFFLITVLRGVGIV